MYVVLVQHIVHVASQWRPGDIDRPDITSIDVMHFDRDRYMLVLPSHKFGGLFSTNCLYLPFDIEGRRPTIIKLMEKYSNVTPFSTPTLTILRLHSRHTNTSFHHVLTYGSKRYDILTNAA